MEGLPTHSHADWELELANGIPGPRRDSLGSGDAWLVHNTQTGIAGHLQWHPVPDRQGKASFGERGCSHGVIGKYF